MNVNYTAHSITVRTVDRWEEMKEIFGFGRDGVLLEPDLDIVENDCELFSRKRRDAEVLTMIAANCSGNALDIGTSHGRSAYKLATNIPDPRTVYTVNILPEQMDATSGKMITHLLTKEDIGSYYRQFHLDNITQLYANTATWDMPPEIKGLGMVFVDGAHDTDLVYSDSRKAFECLADGGFMLWHDFSPELRQKFDWIDACMRGVERFCAELGAPVEIVHLRNSWIGVMRKKSAGSGVAVTNRENNPGIAIDRMKGLKFVIAYPSYSTGRQEEDERLISRLRSFGYDVEGFPIPCLDGWWPFEKLDKAWQEKDSRLMKPYAALRLLMESKDVLISSGGSMLHPGFLGSLKAVTVSIAADDPESSDILTRPVVPAFDLALTVNPGCVEMYRSWGAQRAGWIFSPVLPEMMDPSVTEQSILEGERNVDVIFLGAKVTPVEDRAARLADLLERFPQAVLAGPGWPLGSIEPSLWYPRTKIGWNFTNNTVGPNNTRTWHLPALGVMQICDNKAQLGKVFTLDREVVGYDTLQECSDKTRYYLDHDSERREIARNGWKRATTQYTLDRWWQALLNQLEPVCFPETSISRTPDLCETSTRGSRPRVALLVDRPGWAYDHAAQAISARLADEFEFRIFYVVDRPDLFSWDFDLLHVFFWGETYHQSFGIDPRKVIKEVSSHRWALEDAYGKLDAEAMCSRYLADAGSVTATSVRLQKLVAPYREILHVPNGIDGGTFLNQGRRTGPLVIGWAGNVNDPCKGISDILVPAAGTEFALRIAGGDLDHDRMREFYNSIDVLCVASTAEGEPLTLLEAMACGCFPVCVDVGIVPEVVRHGENGLVVERSVPAFRAAFQWCAANTEFIRGAGAENAIAIGRQRDWDAVTPAWRNALQAALGKPKDWIWHNNLGATLLEWPGRAEEAGRLIQSLGLRPSATLLDLGCGHQTFRKFLPSSIRYTGVDRTVRVPGTRVIDLETELPTEQADVVTMLGVLEYLGNPSRILKWAAEHSRYFLFSLNDCTNEAVRARQHWKCRSSFEEVENWVREFDGRVVRVVDLGKSERVYLVEFLPQEIVVSAGPGRATARRRTLALLSAGVNGDNSGDALIEDAVRRLLGGHTTKTFPLLKTLTPAQLEEVNACDAAVICGTNLYQHVFSCSLTPDVIRSIHVPIIPLGIGGSAPIGKLPVMNNEGVLAVRMIHERCLIGSVRDPLSLAFVESLGIKNVALTGCPVLFHAGRKPVFANNIPGNLVVSVRARLLHVEDALSQKEYATLDRLGSEFHPSLLLQSPYDVDMAAEIAQRHGLPVLADHKLYGHEVMVDAVKRASRTFGFRLHFGMLSLSYGKAASFVATDTRTSEFCNMMGLPYHDIANYSIEDVVNELRSPAQRMDRVVARWSELFEAMQDMLAANGLAPSAANAVEEVERELVS